MQKKGENLTDVDLLSILSHIPKTEIHLHLEGLASVETIWSLMNKHSLSVEGIQTKDDLIHRFAVKASTNLFPCSSMSYRTVFKKSQISIFS